jgi:hypothetical protein
MFVRSQEHWNSYLHRSCFLCFPLHFCYLLRVVTYLLETNYCYLRIIDCTSGLNGRHYIFSICIFGAKFISAYLAVWSINSSTWSREKLYMWCISHQWPSSRPARRHWQASTSEFQSFVQPLQETQALPRVSGFAEWRARHNNTHGTATFAEGRAVGRLRPSA